MEKVISLFISMLMLVLPTVVNAHTEITSSTPSAGQVVTEETKIITLTFRDEIEPLSTMTLMKDGKEMKFESIQTKGNVLIGSIVSPLESGSYYIKWNIAGEDGHLITGEIPFTVQFPNAVEEETQNARDEESNEQEFTQEEKEVVTESDRKSDNNIKVLIPIVAILLLVIGLVTLFKRGDKK